MKDFVGAHATEQRLHRSGIAKVALDQLDAFLDPLDVLGTTPPSHDPVDFGVRMVSKDVFGKMTAGESGDSGYESSQGSSCGPLLSWENNFLVRRYFRLSP